MNKEPEGTKSAEAIEPLIDRSAGVGADAGLSGLAKASSPSKGQEHPSDEHQVRVGRSTSNHHAPSPSNEFGGTIKPANNPLRKKVPKARRMSLSLTHVNAWSVAKVSFLLCVAGGIIQVAAAALIWFILNIAGVFDQITQIVSSTGLNAGNFNLSSIFSLTTVMSAMTILSIFGAVLITILATIGALLYNVVSALVGGIHVTLGDD